MLTRLAGASIRAALVAGIIVLPALMLPELSPTSADLAILAAAIAAAFVIFEYGFITPSLIEFRFAAPYNRVRFAILALLLTATAFAFRVPVESTATSFAVSSFAVTSAKVWSFTGSPLTFFTALLENTDSNGYALLTNAAALALSVTTMALFVFSVTIWVFAWPLNAQKFNLWMNLPNFGTTSGSETQNSLRQSALTSLVIGLILPFLIPLATLTFMGPLSPITANNSLLLIWMIAIWCFVPSAAILRSVALYKIATIMATNETTPPRSA